MERHAGQARFFFQNTIMTWSVTACLQPVKSLFYTGQPTVLESCRVRLATVDHIFTSNVNSSNKERADSS